MTRCPSKMTLKLNAKLTQYPQEYVQACLVFGAAAAKQLALVLSGRHVVSSIDNNNEYTNLAMTFSLRFSSNFRRHSLSVSHPSNVLTHRSPGALQSCPRKGILSDNPLLIFCSEPTSCVLLIWICKAVLLLLCRKTENKTPDWPVCLRASSDWPMA